MGPRRMLARPHRDGRQDARHGRWRAGLLRLRRRHLTARGDVLCTNTAAGSGALLVRQLVHPSGRRRRRRWPPTLAADAAAVRSDCARAIRSDALAGQGACPQSLSQARLGGGGEGISRIQQTLHVRQSGQGWLMANRRLRLGLCSSGTACCCWIQVVVWVEPLRWPTPLSYAVQGNSNRAVSKTGRGIYCLSFIFWMENFCT